MAFAESVSAATISTNEKYHCSFCESQCVRTFLLSKSLIELSFSMIYSVYFSFWFLYVQIIDLYNRLFHYILHISLFRIYIIDRATHFTTNLRKYNLEIRLMMTIERIIFYIKMASTFPLRNCHCAECCTIQNFKDNHLHGTCSCLPRFFGDLSEKQSQTY